MPVWVTRLTLHREGIRPAWEDSAVPQDLHHLIVLKPYERVGDETFARKWFEVKAALAAQTPRIYWFVYDGDGTGIPGVKEYVGVLPPWIAPVRPPVLIDPDYKASMRQTINSFLTLAEDGAEWPKVVKLFHRCDLGGPFFDKIQELQAKLQELIGA